MAFLEWLYTPLVSCWEEESPENEGWDKSGSLNHFIQSPFSALCLLNAFYACGYLQFLILCKVSGIKSSGFLYQSQSSQEIETISEVWTGTNRINKCRKQLWLLGWRRVNQRTKNSGKVPHVLKTEIQTFKERVCLPQEYADQRWRTILPVSTGWSWLTKGCQGESYWVFCLLICWLLYMESPFILLWSCNVFQNPLLTKPNVKLVGKKEMSTRSSSSIIKQG